MEKGKYSMVRAYQALNRKPAVLLLFLPLALPEAAITKLIPRPSSLEQLAFGSPLLRMVSMGTNALLVLLSLASLFLLMPPVTELLHDAVRGSESETGWYVRGIRNHWWKPAASFFFEGMASLLVAFLFVAALLVGTVLYEAVLSSISGAANLSPSSLTGLAVVLGLGFLLVIVVMVAVEAFFSLLLPALADKSFGSAFSLLWGRGMRKYPKLLLANLIYWLGNLLFVAALFLGYVWLNGGWSGSLELWGNAIVRFASSWTFSFCILVGTLFKVFLYSYRFTVYQEIREEETAETTERELPAQR